MIAKIIQNSDVEPIQAPWGSLQWLVSADGSISENMTLGRVTIKPGTTNPIHRHPNCEEILYVLAGSIEHSLPQGGSATLNPGDCIVLPQGSEHQARNIGSEEAVVLVAFNSANRKTIGE